MKKVLLVSCEGLGKGGVQSVMMTIVRNLYRDYVFDALLFTDETRYYDNEFLSYGGRIFRIPHYSGNSLLRKKMDYYIRGNGVYKSVLKILKENGPYDVVHCNNEYESAFILKAAAKVNVPVRISHTHVITQKGNFIFEIAKNVRKNAIERYATIKIGCSKEAINSFFKSSDNALIVDNAYDETKFDKDKYENGSVDEKIRLIQVGSFSDNKNQIFAIEVVDCIRELYPSVQIIFIGFDMLGYESIMKNEITVRHLEKFTSFECSDADIPMLLSKSSALLLPSKKEGFGIVLVEAQAMGVRCYASDTVPIGANCGGVEYLPLSAGANVWAEKIVEDYKSGMLAHVKYDCSRFTTARIVGLYKKLYEG